MTPRASKRTDGPPRIEDWGFGRDARGHLCIGDHSAEDLADRYGTPLMVFDEAGLRRRARAWRDAFASCHPGPVDVRFALKCNSTPAVVAAVLEEGLLPEACTPYEWDLARRLGVPAARILLNGPGKDALLEHALEAGPGPVVLDGLQELAHLERRATAFGRTVDVLLRVNPDRVPRGMNRATATGSRRGSVFGFDVASGEADAALRRLADGRTLRYVGLHAHAGSGIRGADEYPRVIERLLRVAHRARELGLATEVLDVGGGFGVPTSRELTTREFLAYQAWGALPPSPRPEETASFEDFARAISRALVDGCRRHGLPLPRLVVEPGRSVASQAGVLLVRVQRIKPRRGVDPWAIADGAAGTVAFPLYHELHEILLARDPAAPATRRYSIVGSCCHSADWICRKKRMPELREGDVLAICDAGAYFTVQERGFGTPRPPVVFVRDDASRIVRRRETFDDMTARDVFPARRGESGGATESSRPAPGADAATVPAGARMRAPGPSTSRPPCSLGPADAPDLAALADEAFGEHAFYTHVMGLDRAALSEYWRTYFECALGDPAVRLLGIRAGGRLVAAAAIAGEGYPSTRAFLRFLARLGPRIGPRALARFLRFAVDYERFMRGFGSRNTAETRGLWLMGSRRNGHCGGGADLVRHILDRCRAERRPLVAFVDGSDSALLRFYRRLGFLASQPRRFHGRPAVRIRQPLEEAASC